METVIIVIHLMLVLALVGVVLLQKSEGGALGMGGGGGGLMSSRGTANVLTRTTAILGAGFFATSLILAILAGKSAEKPSSIIDKAAAPIAAPGAPSTPAAPAGTGGGILDTLQQMQKSGQPAPAPTPAPAPAK